MNARRRRLDVPAMILGLLLGSVVPALAEGQEDPVIDLVAVSPPKGWPFCGQIQAVTYLR